jgi:hypothetical protein
MAKFKIVWRDGEETSVEGHKAGQHSATGDYAIYETGGMDAAPVALVPKELVRLILREEA